MNTTHPARESRIPVLLFMFVVLADFLRGSNRAGNSIALWPVALFFLPKINLITVKNETAGIRIDDVILLIVAILLLWTWILRLELGKDSLAWIGFAVVGLFCISNVVNLGHSSFLYSLRFAEYLVFLWSGKFLAEADYNFARFVKILIGINCGTILLQYAGLVGGFAASGYSSEIDRPFGLTNHPAEMGALLNVLFAVLVFGSSTKFWKWCVLVLACIFLTGSRSALLAHCLLTLVYLYRHSRNSATFALRTVAVFGLLAAALVLVPNPTRTRSTEVFSSQNVEAIKALYDAVPADTKFAGFVNDGDIEGVPDDVDVSWYARGFKWVQVIKVLVNAPTWVWIFGFGPGALGPALDGGWLRLLGETGIIGLTAFIVMMGKIARLGIAASMVVLALSVNMLMIDSHIAYKVMAFVFLYAGYAYSLNRAPNSKFNEGRVLQAVTGR